MVPSLCDANISYSLSVRSTRPVWPLTEHETLSGKRVRSTANADVMVRVTVNLSFGRANRFHDYRVY